MRWIKEIGFAFVALTLFMTILQTDSLFHYTQTIFLFKIFVFVSIPVIVLWIVMSIRDYVNQRGILYYCVQKFSSLSIPREAKYIIVFVLFENFIAIGLGKQRYPFFDYTQNQWIFIELSIASIGIELFCIMLLFNRRCHLAIFIFLMVMHFFLYLTGVLGFMLLALILSISLIHPAFFEILFTPQKLKTTSI